MTDPFIGEIMIVGFNFAPRGWAFCNGQLLPISQNTALFSLLGTTYGGDGRTTFGLPDLQGRAALHTGQGPGLSSRSQGQRGGAVTVTLTEAQLPMHTHTAQASAAVGNAPGPAGNHTAQVRGFSYGNTSDTTMTPAALGNVGGGIPHNNLGPSLVLNVVIALQGTYPSRN